MTETTIPARSASEGWLQEAFAPPARAGLMLTTATRWFAHARGTNNLELGAGDSAPVLLFVAALTSYGLICWAMARALMALHRTAAWKMAIAATFAVIATALFFGSVLPEGNYGWHPYIRVDVRGESGVSFGFRG